jgi:thioredoxin-like negative regulator of GroEL
MTKESIEAYTLIQQTFPQSQYAQRVTAILRRLKLAGNPPQLSGPTLSGDQVVLDDLLGQPVLVVFWSTEAKPFVSALPTLLEITRAHRKEGLKVVGITLDTDATAVNQFLVDHKVPWPQIFFAEEGKQGWNNPIASYYGIMEIPALWLIDQSGNVVSTTTTVENLDVELSQLLGGASPKAKQAAEEGVKNALSETPAPAKKKATRKSPAKPVEEE